MSGTSERPSTMTVEAWRSDNSQFHTRRRACLAGRGPVPERLAVLVIDQPDQVAHLRAALAGQPVEIAAVDDTAHGLLAIGRTCPDVVVLGRPAGPLGPLQFVEVLRADEPDLPLIVGIGADDSSLAGRAAMLGAAVLAHPFAPDQLLRTLSAAGPTRDPVEVRPLTLDLGRLRIDGLAPQIWLDGRLIRLPMREFLLLRFLAERAGAVLTHAEILRATWGRQDTGKSARNTLVVHVMRLRKRLGDTHATDTRQQWIRVIRGLGYQFTIPSSSPGSSDI